MCYYNGVRYFRLTALREKYRIMVLDIAHLVENTFQNKSNRYTVQYAICSAQKNEFSIEDFFCKCDQIRSILGIWSHLLKISLMENFIFYAAIVCFYVLVYCFYTIGGLVITGRTHCLSFYIHMCYAHLSSVRFGHSVCHEPL